MIDLFIFDMGGVLIRDYHIGPELNEFLGSKDALNYNDNVSLALRKHSEGKIDEKEFWKVFENETKIHVSETSGSLLGKFFHPVLDTATLNLIRKLKEKGKRVVCGTNVIESHYKIHNLKNQYEVFDKVYPSHLMHVSKPKSEFFDIICNKEKCCKNRTFFTDDSKINIE
ncbi:MAG: haloacid dehalogenase, partial [Sphaerochaetaceae bacterium]|nr:haloacid dehalogenase [Sphaerochaetaceae bacterium]